ncbi:MAG: biosynthetic arginine decarboxylase [Candidatus Thiodiazotropha sp. (ex Myrtea sp. 'scaly one' KF741663)]|nr:biosynthetic arginine decarboxylase [Candidatus Thiodiazotropha sp. (ex Myrtea sp. 'scaly one' KF741663)]
MSDKVWQPKDAEALYQTEGWSNGYFSVNDHGHLEAIADGFNGIDLMQLCNELAEKNIHPPMLLRFSDILKSRMEQIYRRFEIAREEADYEGEYFGVYPVKVNQQYQVVEEIIEFGAYYNWGLEAGSKPELHATLAMLDDTKRLIICNGYKDREYIELAMIGCKMGKRVFVVIEKPQELDLILASAQRLDVKPLIGLRCKLATTSNGRWDDSGGDMSKFGLSASELLDAINKLSKSGYLDSLRLLHFHIGSQVPEIRTIKEAMQEVARYFVEALHLGAPIEFIDVGGGLGVNYDGSISNSISSVDYSLQEYANDIVWTMKHVCEQEGLQHPHIISESGRALVAHHSVLIVDVLAVTCPTGQGDEATEILSGLSSEQQQVRQMQDTLNMLDENTAREAVHDAMAVRADINKLFSLGHASLTDRAAADRLYWQIVSRLLQMLSEEEIEQIAPDLPLQAADRYFCNFSVFQSLPDAWAINQVFPVMPIHRLNEKPERQGILVDITCDSDGKLQQFPLQEGTRPTLPLHQLNNGDKYLIGIFLTGAYQEILGDLHNLFGDTHAIHIRMDGDSYELEQVLEGESVADVLDYVQFHETVLIDRMRRQMQQARNNQKLSAREANAFLRFYQLGLKGYTYLEEDIPLP